MKFSINFIINVLQKTLHGLEVPGLLEACAGDQFTCGWPAILLSRLSFILAIQQKAGSVVVRLIATQRMGIRTIHCMYQTFKEYLYD
jgi:hypothetical protein